MQFFAIVESRPSGDKTAQPPGTGRHLLCYGSSSDGP